MYRLIELVLKALFSKEQIRLYDKMIKADLAIVYKRQKENNL